MGPSTGVCPHASALAPIYEDWLMHQRTPEEEKRILESPPRGTYAIMLIFAAVFTLAWLLLYFGRFLAHGPVS